MDGREVRKRARVVDGRSLMVECQEHKGLLLPVTDIHISYTQSPDGERMFVIFMEALCVYCNTYKYFRVSEGVPTRLSDEDTTKLEAVRSFVTRCPGMLLEEVLDVMTAAGGSRAALATIIHMGVRASLAGVENVDGRLYPVALTTAPTPAPAITMPVTLTTAPKLAAMLTTAPAPKLAAI